MTFFILWVVFILVVILSVPITSFLEKRKYRAEHGSPAESLDDQEALEEQELDQVAEDGEAVVELEEDQELPAEAEATDEEEDLASFGEIR